VFRDVGQANQADGKPCGAQKSGLGIKEFCQENGKNSAQYGPKDEYDQCTQGDTSLAKTRDLYISETS